MDAGWGEGREKEMSVLSYGRKILFGYVPLIFEAESTAGWPCGVVKERDMKTGVIQLSGLWKRLRREVRERHIKMSQ